jgi:8-oxo-dGTP diphosphatase
MTANQKVQNIRARLILIAKDQVLIAHEWRTDTYFLPGGGIEHGEGAIECLRREISEECNIQLPDSIAPFGIIENRFVNGDSDVHETLIHFCAEMEDADPPPVLSREEHLRFVWLPVDGLGGKTVWPLPTQHAITAAHRREKGFFYSNLKNAMAMEKDLRGLAGVEPDNMVRT